MYVKQAHNDRLTKKFRDRMLKLYDKIKPVKRLPKRLQAFKKGDDRAFKDLNKVGEFSVEAMLVLNELIFIQEKTNYPKGSATQRLYKMFGQKDRFSVIAAATWNG